MGMSHALYRRASETQHVDIGEELVALDIRTGSCFGFNSVAAAVWHNLETPKSFEELRDILLNEYEVTAEQCSSELQALLDDLIDKGLLATQRG
jgi:hypothetical protein